jgi:hypothetical protein
MRPRFLVVANVCLLAALVWGSSAGAQYMLFPGPAQNQNGAQLQVGVDFPFPAASGIFLGGMTPINGGTMGGGAMTGLPPEGPGPAFWPPLLIRRIP